jgi:hypothetical protein
MAKVRSMGEACLQEAEQGVKFVTRNQEEARRAHSFMKAYKLLCDYYDRKVAAATAALIYSHTHKTEDRAEAERLADDAVASYMTAGTFMHETLDPILIELKGAPMTEMEFPARVNKDVPGLMQAEKEERARLAEIFRWNG